jgi:hypothetical protein
MPELVRERIMAGVVLKAEAPAMQAARMVACKEIAYKNPSTAEYNSTASLCKSDLILSNMTTIYMLL